MEEQDQTSGLGASSAQGDGHPGEPPTAPPQGEPTEQADAPSTNEAETIGDDSSKD